MTVRVLTPAPGLTVGQSDEAILRRVLAWLRDPGEVTALVLHAPGSHVWSDGRECVVDAQGQLVSA